MENQDVNYYENYDGTQIWKLGLKTRMEIYAVKL